MHFTDSLNRKPNLSKPFCFSKLIFNLILNANHISELHAIFYIITVSLLQLMAFRQHNTHYTV